MARLALTLVFAGIVLCQAFDEDPRRLVGAKNAQPGQFPYAVSLRLYGQHICGGSIIGPQHILTAAHCVKPLEGHLNEASVVSGSIDLRTGGEHHRISGMWAHPQYNGNNKINNDIGVIKLSEPIHFNNNQKSVPLPLSRPPVSRNQAVVSAWGKMSDHDDVSNILQYLYLNIIDLKECQKYHDLDVSSSAICTFNKVGAGLCNGDSGSPLVFNGRVVGVVSRGIPCARGIPDVFTSVYDTLSFVKNAMKH